MPYPKRLTQPGYGALLRRLILLFLLLCTASPSAGAQAEQWHGEIRQGNGPCQVELTVTPDEDGSQFTYKLHYGPPRNCWLLAKSTASIQKKKALSLRVGEASGGFCDTLWDSSISLKLAGQKRLEITVQGANDLSEETVLTK